MTRTRSLPFDRDDVTARRVRAHGERGYVLALTALLVFPLMAFTGFAVDLGFWTARAAEIQATADAAALSGVTYLPNVTRATTEARQVASMNGFTDGVDGVTVDVTPIGNAQLRVTISDGDVEQFFTSIFTDTVSIERGAVAEFIKPVPMGSPRNYLGTGGLFSGGSEPPPDNFWVSVSGYCARREMGDRITAHNASNGSPFEGCDSTAVPSTSQLGLNPEWRSYGYFYAIELDDGDSTAGETWPFTPRIDVYDAAHCQGSGSGAGDSGSDTASARQYQFILRANDNPDPLASTIINGASGVTVTTADCGTYSGSWQSMGSLQTALGGTPTEGIYYLQINPVVPGDQTGTNAQEGQNQMSLRAVNPAWGASDSSWPCTGDPTTTAANVEFNAHCPRLYGLSHLGVYASFNGSQPSFYLASVDDHHAGRDMTVELFDTAEGAAEIEILDPLGNPVSFDWEIACQTGEYQSEGATCSGENAPAYGYGTSPVSITSFPVFGGVGTAYRAFGSRDEQNGLYSNRLLRLKFRLPTKATNPTWYGGNTWFRIRYTTCDASTPAPPAPAYDISCSTGDRTTWSVSISGDPVRLIE